VAVCQVVDLRTLLPVAVRDTTASEPASTDEASCGDGAVGPLRRYRLDGVPPGRYRVSAQASFDVVIDVRRPMCGGEELACEAAYSGNVATFLLTWTSAQTIVIEVAGLAGGAGDFSLDVTPEPQCGDSLCQDETCSSCPADCGACPPPAVCGDGVCTASETCASCPGDCGACPPAPRCGDGSCQAGESCGSCPADCGSCGPSCGDGMCDFGEDCVSCPFDCGACAPGCGDGRCDIGEDCVSCSFDCGTCSDPGPPTDPFPPPDPFPDPGSAPWELNGPGTGTAGAVAARVATVRR